MTQLKKSQSKFSRVIALSLGVLAMVFLISAVVRAWTEPGQTPPGGNVPAPINIGSTTQTKAGALGVNGGFFVDGYEMVGSNADRLYANPRNSTGGGIVVSDDGGFYDDNDGWIKFKGILGLHMNSKEICLTNGCRSDWPIGDGVDLFGWSFADNYFYDDGEAVIRATDEWLRLNQNSSGTSDFTSGVYTPGLIRADGGFQVDGKAVIDNNAGWHRAHGNTGFYFQDYGGGWHMTDTTWIRAYNSKNVYTSAIMRADNGFQVDGYEMVGSNADMLYANRRNTSGGGIWVSDDGGFYDYNNAYIDFRGTTGIRVLESNGTWGDNSIRAHYLCLENNCIDEWSDVGGAGYWAQSGSNLYPNNTGWNVGIGTNDPGNWKLTVVGPSYSSGVWGGIFGSAGEGGYGVYGSVSGGSGAGVTGWASGASTGVFGNSSASGKGVWGASASGYGVYGQSSYGTSGRGVYGRSPSGYGVYGGTVGGYGVYGYSETSDSWAGFFGGIGNVSAENYYIRSTGQWVTDLGGGGSLTCTTASNTRGAGGTGVCTIYVYCPSGYQRTGCSGGGWDFPYSEPDGSTGCKCAAQCEHTIRCYAYCCRIQ